MARRIQIPKTKKGVARPQKEWIEFGWGQGKMRDASWARSEEDIKAAAFLLADLVLDRAKIVKDSSHVYQSYWYGLQECKKILADAEEKMLKDLFNLGVSVPEIFAWDRMSIPPTTKPKKPRKRNEF